MAFDKKAVIAVDTELIRFVVKLNKLKDLIAEDPKILEHNWMSLPERAAVKRSAMDLKMALNDLTRAKR